MHRSNHDSNQVIYRARHGRSHLLVFGSYSYARFAANSVSPSFGSRNRNIKKGRVAWTHSQPTCIAMHGTISCIDPPPPPPLNARNSNNRCGIRVDIYGHVRQGNWVRKIHPRDSADIHRTRGEAVNLKARNDTDTPIRGCGETFRMLIGRHWYSRWQDFESVDCGGK